MPSFFFLLSSVYLWYGTDILSEQLAGTEVLQGDCLSSWERFCNNPIHKGWMSWDTVSQHARRENPGSMQEKNVVFLRIHIWENKVVFFCYLWVGSALLDVQMYNTRTRFKFWVVSLPLATCLRFLVILLVPTFVASEEVCVLCSTPSGPFYKLDPFLIAAAKWTEK